MRYKVIKFTPEDARGVVYLTIEAIPNKLASLFGAKPKIKYYMGECTIWYEIIDGNLKSCDIDDEIMLYDITQNEKFKLNKINP